MERFELPERACQRLAVAAYRGVSLAARGNFMGQVAVCFVDCRQAGLERFLRGALGLFRAIQRGDVACDSDLADQFALGVQQRRRLERDADHFAALLAPLGGGRGRISCAEKPYKEPASRFQ